MAYYSRVEVVTKTGTPPAHVKSYIEHGSYKLSHLKFLVFAHHRNV